MFDKQCLTVWPCLKQLLTNRIHSAMLLKMIQAENAKMFHCCCPTFKHYVWEKISNVWQTMLDRLAKAKGFLLCRKFQVKCFLQCSTRKRMSVIVKTPTGQIKLYCKGAVSVLDFLKPYYPPYLYYLIICFLKVLWRCGLIQLARGVRSSTRLGLSPNYTVASNQGRGLD